MEAMMDKTELRYEEILSRLNACRSATDLAAHAEWLRKSGCLDESEQTVITGSAGPLAPWACPVNSTTLWGDCESLIIQLGNGNLAEWSGVDHMWHPVDSRDRRLPRKLRVSVNDWGTITTLTAYGHAFALEHPGLGHELLARVDLDESRPLQDVANDIFDEWVRLYKQQPDQSDYGLIVTVESDGKFALPSCTVSAREALVNGGMR